MSNLDANIMEKPSLNNSKTVDVMFEQVAVGMVFSDVNGGICRVNKKFAHMLGYKQDELINVRVQTLTYYEDQLVEAEFCSCIRYKQIKRS